MTVAAPQCRSAGNENGSLVLSAMEYKHHQLEKREKSSDATFSL